MSFLVNRSKRKVCPVCSSTFIDECLRCIQDAEYTSSLLRDQAKSRSNREDSNRNQNGNGNRQNGEVAYENGNTNHENGNTNRENGNTNRENRNGTHVGEGEETITSHDGKIY